MASALSATACSTASTSVLTTAIMASTSLTSRSWNCSDMSCLHLWRICGCGDDEAIDDPAPCDRRRQFTFDRAEEQEAQRDGVTQRHDRIGSERGVDGAVGLCFV